MPRKTLIAAGVSNFKLSEYNLKGPSYDLTRMRRLVEEDHGYDDVFVLKDEEALEEHILDVIHTVRGKAKDGDMYDFYYTGHGYRAVIRDSLGRRKLVQCIAPWNTDFSDPKFQHFYTKTLREALTPLGSKNVHVAAIFDSCFSGDALRDITTGNTNLQESVTHQTTNKPKAIRGPHWDIEDNRDLVHRTMGVALIQDARVICLAACRDNETAADTVINNEPGGALTFGLVAAHATPENNTWRGLTHDISFYLSEMGYKQHPVISGSEAKFDDPSFTIKGSRLVSGLVADVVEDGLTNLPVGDTSSEDSKSLTVGIDLELVGKITGTPEKEDDDTTPFEDLAEESAETVESQAALLPSDSVPEKTVLVPEEKFVPEKEPIKLPEAASLISTPDGSTTVRRRKR